MSGTRLILRASSGFLAMLTLTFWFFGGMHRGWTHTTETRMAIDPVTTIEYPVTEKKFLPGVDFLGGGLLTAGILFAVSYFFRPKTYHSTPP